MATTTVRASEHSHQVLRALSDQRGVSMTEALDEVIEDWERRRFFEDLNSAFTQLKEDPEAWEEELAERAQWDEALLDDLDDDAPAGEGA